MKNVCIAMIAHNQFFQIKEQLNSIADSIYDGDSIVIVDLFSDDGLNEWLRGQSVVDYILCDKLENYAKILNTVKDEFGQDKDLIIVHPDQKINYSRLRSKIKDSHIGMISIKSDIKDFEQIMSVEYHSFLLSCDCWNKNGKFDENIHLPENVLMDYSFRAETNGHSIMALKENNETQMLSSEDIYDNWREITINQDRKYLAEKWHMNYFNMYPNRPLISMIKENRNSRFSVLEIGCDCGANLCRIKNLYPNVELHGVEINEKAAGIACILADVKVENIENKTLDFKDKTFDYILFGDVLEHLRDPESVIIYCREKLLQPGGKILACIPNLMHYSVLKQLINGYFTYTDTGLLDKTHIHFFTLNEILLMFERAGYEIEELRYTGGKQYADIEEQRFVQKLLNISEQADEEMFYAFQYVVAAKIN